MEHIYLSGAEDVQRAGRSMIAAADQMLQAANIISESVSRLEVAIRNHEIWAEQQPVDLTQRRTAPWKRPAEPTC